jgi:hypothetical protein
MLSHKRKCIFVHIPKTGGTSVENLIWCRKRDRVESNLWKPVLRNKYQTGGLQHLLASQIRQEVGDACFQSYFKFTIVRNPWDKAVSQFAYMRGRKVLRGLIGMPEDACFKTYLSLIQKEPHVQWESQHRFFLDDHGERLVDFIGRFESLEDDVRTILGELKMGRHFLGRRRKIPHANRSQRVHYRDYYDTESQGMVADLYGKDIETLGYTF